jgi:DNA-directed RNA polymerase alpha subunit
MTEDVLQDIAELIDWLTKRPVKQIRVTHEDMTLFLRFRDPEPRRTQGVRTDSDTELRATGTGIFHHRHPDTLAEMFCIEAGSFLFPVQANPDTAAPLAQEGARVEFGTPLLTITRLPSEKAELT